MEEDDDYDDLTMVANALNCLFVYQLKSIDMWITHKPVYKFCVNIFGALISRAAVTN
jgi:hypothetical protein